MTSNKNNPITVEPWDGVKTIWDCNDCTSPFMPQNIPEELIISEICSVLVPDGLCPRGYANPFGEKR